MKNFYFLLSAAFVSFTASAQVDFVHRNLATVQPQEKVTNAEVSVSVFKSQTPSMKTKAPTADFNIYPSHGPGLFMRGMNADYIGAQGNHAVVPAGVTSYFLPNITKPYDPMEAEWSWKVRDLISNEEVDITDTEDSTRGALNIWAQTSYPTISATLDGTTVSYDLDALESNSSAGTGIQRVAPIFGKCDVVFTNGIFSVPVSNFDLGGGSYGGYNDTTFVYSNKQVNDKRNTPIGAFDLYETGDAGALIHEVIVAMVMADSEPTYIIPEGHNIKIEIKEYEKDSEGKITFGDVLGEVESSTVLGNVKPNMIAMMSFKFQEESGGSYYPQPIEIPAHTKFAIVLSGWTPDCNMRLIFGRNINRNGFLLYEDGSYWSVNGTESGADFAFQMVMEVPTVTPDYPEMFALADGGFLLAEEPNVEGGIVNYNILNTAVKMYDEEYIENYTIEVPEWVTYEHQDINEVGEDATSGYLEVTQQDTNDGFVYGWDYIHAYGLFMQAQPLPEGEDSREGTVKIINKLGEEYTFTVKQSKDFTGVESIAAPKAAVAVAGDNLMLTYGEEYNTVTVYNVAGSEVASYALPQGGSFEVPASDLNGVYMVVFEGTSREVVKVVK